MELLSASSSGKPTRHSTTYASYTTTTPGNLYSTSSGSASQPSKTSGGDSGPAANLSPQQKQVIGGVVGAVAGIAVLGLLLMAFLRYKRRKGKPIILDAQAGSGSSRALGDGSSSGDGSGSAMADRSSTSAAVAAAFASLTGKANSKLPASHSASNERGFYRVSGRKLPSVLDTGGDGYSDPRGSGASGQSDYFRGSQAFQPSKPGGLALGEPMRPVSGVPIMRSGPAKVAIAENPFADPASPTSPAAPAAPSTPSAPASPPGRTLGSRDSPRATGSRFQEKI